ncbi:hypothetical protein [Geminisphaera colitermitum]|uniref:hypothetical protein n=1 Tax=Geminisphaera colitermitum TaxID=1148786 RepID=UPI000158D4B0|nr:hypothetical protein [Geminisphaera colitermitum]
MNPTNKISHTPGPWKVREDYTGDFLTELEIIADNSYYHRIARINAEEESALVQEQGANARLIAAAPELLAALKECLDLLTVGHNSHAYTVVRAGKAIAKAEGRE